MTSITLEDIARRVSQTGWIILEILTKVESSPSNHLKERLSISHEKLQKEIARLDGPLLIDRSIDEFDARKLSYSISNYGLELFNKYNKLYKKGR